MIFDLDGTLINAIADLANGTNYALSQCEDFQLIKPMSIIGLFGNGIKQTFEERYQRAKAEENILHAFATCFASLHDWTWTQLRVNLIRA